MLSSKKKSSDKKAKTWSEDDVLKFGLAGEEEHFYMAEESYDDDRLTIATEEHFADFYPSTDGKMETPPASEITKSGRMRKKTAKLIEMEEVDMLEKIPRKSEPSKSKKSKALKASDRVAAASVGATPLSKGSVFDEDDVSPFVISNVFTMSSSKSQPISPTSFPMVETVLSPSKSKKAKSKKSSGGFVGDTFMGSGETVVYDSEMVSVDPNVINSITPKKSPKKKSNVVPPFTIKLENTGEHSIIGTGSVPPLYVTNEIQIPLANSFPGEFLQMAESGLTMKEEMDQTGSIDGSIVVKKEKSKKKEKTGVRINVDASTKAAKLKKLKIGKRLQNVRKESEKPKKKRQKGYTAYMLWCSVQRAKVVAQNPGIDFAQISKRLGDMWQTVPEREKMTLRRKARRIAKKGTALIKTGFAFKDEMSAADTNDKKMLFNVKPSKIKLRPVDDSTLKTMTVDHIDVAAHLKLLGESLTTIGARLQEHKGNIAVQGSLSVLLDSLLCTLGPLMCLTNQVPQLNGCAEDVHRSTLENIAYIMPGVG